MSTTVNTSTNTVTISEEKSSVLVTNNNTGTSVDVTGIDAPTVTVSSPGPKGDKGEPGSVSDYSGTLSGDHINLSGNITASGNISSSGDLSVAGNATVDGDVFVSQYIKHRGDEDTFINFTDNRIRFKAGNIGFFDMEKDASVPYPATINPGGNRINFRVVDRNTELLLKTDSEASKVNLYYAGNQKLETAVGGINVTGNITASGNLKVDGSQVDFTNLPTSDPSVAGRLWNSASYVKISAG